MYIYQTAHRVLWGKPKFPAPGDRINKQLEGRDLGVRLSAPMIFAAASRPTLVTPEMQFYYLALLTKESFKKLVQLHDDLVQGAEKILPSSTISLTRLNSMKDKATEAGSPSLCSEPGLRAWTPSLDSEPGH